jgi:LPXTG-motif cell wall-anchored protein
MKKFTILAITIIMIIGISSAYSMAATTDPGTTADVTATSTTAVETTTPSTTDTTTTTATTPPVVTASPVITTEPVTTNPSTTAPVVTNSKKPCNSNNSNNNNNSNNSSNSNNKTETTTTTTNYTSTNNNYNYYTSNVTVDNKYSKNASTNVSVVLGNNKNVSVDQQIVAKGGSATIKQKLINGGTYEKTFKTTEGRNKIKFRKNGHNYAYDFWVYRQGDTVSDIDTGNVIVLDSTSGNSDSTSTDVSTYKLPQNELITTLPKTGESSNTMLVYTLIGSILIFGGIAFAVKKKIKNN